MIDDSSTRDFVPFMRTDITPDRLRELLHYDYETGIFRWRETRGCSSRISEGDVAGSGSHGYIRIRIDNKVYAAHRLAWLYVYGQWPEKAVDHIDGVRSNNKLENLRLSTKNQNCQNSAKRKNNTTGYTGVSYHKQLNKYAAYINHNKKRRYLGVYYTPEEASQVYELEAKKLFGEFYREPDVR